MNERIRQLAEQAKKYALDAMIKITDKEQALKVYSESYDTKFAELIVQECMAEIQKVKEIKAGHAGPEYTQGFDDGMFVAIRTIEEHFGVEE